jgi:hypothetical protein
MKSGGRLAQVRPRASIRRSRGPSGPTRSMGSHSGEGGEVATVGGAREEDAAQGRVLQPASPVSYASNAPRRSLTDS